MSELEKVSKDWKDAVTAEDNNNNAMNLKYEEWVPIWKGFQPPMWKIFRWAYKIKTTFFTNAYPVSIGSSNEILEFGCHPGLIINNVKYENPMITAKAEELLKFYKTLQEGNADAKISK